MYRCGEARDEIYSYQTKHKTEKTQAQQKKIAHKLQSQLWPEQQPSKN